MSLYDVSPYTKKAKRDPGGGREAGIESDKNALLHRGVNGGRERAGAGGGGGGGGSCR